MELEWSSWYLQKMWLNTELVNSSKAEVHLSIGEQYWRTAQLHPWYFIYRICWCSFQDGSSLKFNLDILTEKSWKLVLFQVPILHRKWNDCLSLEQFNFLLAQHFPIGWWRYMIMLLFEFTVYNHKVCSQGWHRGEGLPFFNFFHGKKTGEFSPSKTLPECRVSPGTAHWLRDSIHLIQINGREKNISLSAFQLNYMERNLGYSMKPCRMRS